MPGTILRQFFSHAACIISFPWLNLNIILLPCWSSRIYSLNLHFSCIPIQIIPPNIILILYHNNVCGDGGGGDDDSGGDYDNDNDNAKDDN
jgi:TRAP-type mannitol/chloroaromatic compound transport system permease large subunit